MDIVEPFRLRMAFMVYVINSYRSQLLLGVVWSLSAQLVEEKCEERMLGKKKRGEVEHTWLSRIG